LAAHQRGGDAEGLDVKPAARLASAESPQQRVDNETKSNPPVSAQRIVAYYESKTPGILRRYGPGPRVHYHTGLVDDPAPADSSAVELRQRLVAGQERMLAHAAAIWAASSTLHGDVLDVGCGLGGGAIFWAQEFGARVTAVTCVPSHVEWVARFAAQAGVKSRVQPLLCDALEVPGKNRFDAAVAVDSSGYLDRAAWFRRVASLLRPGGHVFVIDCFLGRSEYREPFDRYWHTRIGTIAEYLAAARDAGLSMESVEDISGRTEHFWTTTLAAIHAEAREGQAMGEAEAVRYHASIGAHTLVRQGLADRGLRYALLSFCKDVACSG
jgi:cyclopropane fatty-acyl-phospholipid synthase-like methyltransferase